MRPNAVGVLSKVKSFEVIRAIWRSVVKDLGGNIDVARRKASSKRSPAQIAAYIAKYIVKAFREGEAFSNRYTAFGSPDMPKPVHLGHFSTALAAWGAAYSCLLDVHSVVLERLSKWKDWFVLYALNHELVRGKHRRFDPDTRSQLAFRFKAMYRNLGLDLPGCAKLLHVTERTLHNWESGKHDIPFASYKLLRLLNRMDLPGDSWAGWSFHGGKLWTPEGRSFVGTDGSWWSLLVRRAACFDAMFKRSGQF
eukprot:gene19506-27637_t